MDDHDPSLFNVLDDVDISLLGGGHGLEVSKNPDNFEFFLQDIVNPADAIPTGQPQESLSQASHQPQSQPQPVRSSVIVGRSPVSQPVLNTGAPTRAVQILAKPQAKSPQLIQANVVPGPGIIYTNTGSLAIPATSTTVPVTVIPLPKETTSKFILEQDTVHLKPIQLLNTDAETEDDFFGDLHDSGGNRTVRKSGHNAIEKR